MRIASVVLTALVVACAAITPRASAEPNATPPTTNPHPPPITASLDSPIEPGRDVIWCATLQAAWDELTMFAGEPIRVQGDPADAVALGTARFPKAWLGGDGHVTAAGPLASIVPAIERTLREQFPQGHDAKFVDLLKTMPPDQVAAYAYLQANLPFATKFEVLEPEDFYSPVKSGSAQVISFGIDRLSADDPVEVERAKQVRVLWVGRPPAPPDKRPRLTMPRGFSHVIVELTTKHPNDRLILARIDPQPTLRQTIVQTMDRVRNPNTAPVDEAELERRVAEINATGDEDAWRRVGQLRADVLGRSDTMRPGELLRVPAFDFDLTRTFDELSGRPLVVKHAKLAGRPMATVAQRVRFRLDEGGTVLHAEAPIFLALGGTVSPRSLEFDRPFLIMLVRKDAPMPYFAMWVGSAQLIRRPVVTTRPVDELHPHALP